MKGKESKFLAGGRSEGAANKLLLNA